MLNSRRALVLAFVRITAGQVAFQLPTEVMGVASTFEPGDGLPSESFTLSFVTENVRMKRGLRFVMTDYLLSLYIQPDFTFNIDLDSTRFAFDPLSTLNVSRVSELLVPRRM